MRIIHFPIILALSVIALSTTAYSHITHPCWIESVSKSEGSVRVVLDERYRHALQAIRRAGAGTAEIRAPGAGLPAYFDLNDGDTASLRGGAHDWCSVTGSTRNGSLGVLIEARSRPHGLPLSTVTVFVLPTE